MGKALTAGFYVAGLLASLGACARAEDRPAAPPASSRADSIALERTSCFGVCPAYRLSIGRGGAVRFESRDRGDFGRVAAGSITPEAFDSLVAAAERAGFWSLPDTVMGDRELCPVVATDHPGAVVTIIRAGRVKTVTDDFGCYLDAEMNSPRTAARLAPLRALQAAIDSVAGSRRWIRRGSVTLP